jgi:hypothetical protein
MDIADLKRLVNVMEIFNREIWPKAKRLLSLRSKEKRKKPFFWKFYFSVWKQAEAKTCDHCIRSRSATYAGSPDFSIGT